MTPRWADVPDVLQWSLALHGLALVLLLCAAGFVWLAMPTD